MASGILMWFRHAPLHVLGILLYSAFSVLLLVYRFCSQGLFWVWVGGTILLAPGHPTSIICDLSHKNVPYSIRFCTANNFFF